MPHLSTVWLDYVQRTFFPADPQTALDFYPFDPLEHSSAPPPLIRIRGTEICHQGAIKKKSPFRTLLTKKGDHEPILHKRAHSAKKRRRKNGPQHTYESV
jgi:hypothetical protein